MYVLGLMRQMSHKDIVIIIQYLIILKKTHELFFSLQNVENHILLNRGPSLEGT